MGRPIGRSIGLGGGAARFLAWPVSPPLDFIMGILNDEVTMDYTIHIDEFGYITFVETNSRTGFFCCGTCP